MEPACVRPDHGQRKQGDTGVDIVVVLLPVPAPTAARIAGPQARTSPHGWSAPVSMLRSCLVANRSARRRLSETSRYAFAPEKAVKQDASVPAGAAPVEAETGSPLAGHMRGEHVVRR